MAEMEDITEFMSAQNLLQYLRPGDLIEYNRQVYCHWTMYSEHQDYVYNIGALSSTKITAEQAKITLEKLVDVARGDLVRKNNMKWIAESRGLRAKSSREAVRAAQSHLNKIVNYQVLGQNCEYYCTLWKYGVGFSVQAEKGTKVLLEFVATVIGGVVGGPAGAIGALALSIGEDEECEDNNSDSEGERKWKSRTSR